MTRKTASSLLLAFGVAMFILGCSDSTTDSKQPTLVGPPDQNIKGPIKPGTGGASEVKPAPK